MRILEKEFEEILSMDLQDGLQVGKARFIASEGTLAIDKIHSLLREGEVEKAFEVINIFKNTVARLTK